MGYNKRLLPDCSCHSYLRQDIKRQHIALLRDADKEILGALQSGRVGQCSLLLLNKLDERAGFNDDVLHVIANVTSNLWHTAILTLPHHMGQHTAEALLTSVGTATHCK